MSSRTFNVMGFTLPLPMVYSMAAGATAQAPTISTSDNGARQFVMRIVMQAVFDVLERQSRAAGLPDPIIQVILDQLTVNVTYQPLRCDSVSVNPMAGVAIPAIMDMNTCVIIGNTITAICRMAAGCMLNPAMNIEAIPATALTISGTLTTTNVIMANWTRVMWQGVVNRVVRMLAPGPFAANFVSTVATVSWKEKPTEDC